MSQKLRYPILSPTNIPGSGGALYLYLLQTIEAPSRLPHDIWFNGQRQKLENQHDPFKGFFPIGETMMLNYAEKGMSEYTFTGEEQNAVYVKDLHPETKMALGIPSDAKDEDKVYNPNYVSYDNLPHLAKVSNELTTMALAKSLSSLLCAKDILYTEQDVVDMIVTAIKNVNSKEMLHILHGNHLAWCSLAFMRIGKMEEDIKREFFKQNDIDFYVKDIGTILPAMLYCLAVLGENPVTVMEDFELDIWGIKWQGKIGDVPNELVKFMKSEQKEEQKVA